jgi:hypothetical protein
MELAITAPLVLGLVQEEQARIINAAQDLELVHRTNAALWQDIVAQLKVLLIPQNSPYIDWRFSDYCAAPDCQFNYGPACDANMVPAGTNTSSIPRDLLGSVLYGSAGIYDCVNPGDMALTFDDGPFIYTSHILDLLDQYNASATFFITGNNNGKSHLKLLVLLEITHIETRQGTNR